MRPNQGKSARYLISIIIFITSKKKSCKKSLFDNKYSVIRTANNNLNKVQNTEFTLKKSCFFIFREKLLILRRFAAVDGIPHKQYLTILTMNIVKTLRYISLTIILVCSLSASAKVTDLPVKNIDGTECYIYTIKKGDNIYTVSDDLGVRRHDIIKYNSGVTDGLRPGMKIYFPVKDFGQPTGKATVPDDAKIAKIEEPSIEMHPVEIEAEMVEETQENQEMSVAICLPFELQADEMSKNAIHSTDFYRGFLLGIELLRPESDDTPFTITAIDCGDGALSLNANDKDAILNADIVIAPEIATAVNTLSKLATGPNSYVFNVFQTRDTIYLTTPNVIQGNTPSDVLQLKAIDWLIANLGGSKPIILENETGRSDKQAFIEDLIEVFVNKGIEYSTLNYEGTLTSTALVTTLGTAGVNYIFIPSAGSLTEFQRISAALANYKQTVETDVVPGKIRLFGYPEYTRFTGDSYDKLKAIGTSLYSRFYPDFQSSEVMKFERAFNERYGEGLPVGIPNQALYGFDVARWILDLSAKGNPTRENIENTILKNGTQMTYRFVPIENGGLVNDNIFIVTLSDNRDAKIEIL